MKTFLKDDKLAHIDSKNLGNIAQFISITPEMDIKHIKISNFDGADYTLEELIINLINSAQSKSVNIRSFSPEVMKGNKLVYNKKIDDIKEIMLQIKQNCLDGKYSIVNENIDINDGGVSGVILGEIIEFSPKDTPKCVEKEGCCLLSKDLGFYILDKVYGITPESNFDYEYRVEFSIHPHREGVRNTHTIIWEYELFKEISHDFKVNWPNNFSRFIGDKAFGLLISDYLGLNVPYTTVISREVAPFTFGRNTGLLEKWIRTCPIVKESGKYYTGSKWLDPFKLMSDEELKGDKDINIASILSQDSVDAHYSGGAIIRYAEQDDIIEGVKGKGDNFMLGNEVIIKLPNDVLEKVKETMDVIRKHHTLVGDVSIEWVFDGDKVWVVQLNQLKSKGFGNTIVNGNPTYYEEFKVEKGLEALRAKVGEITGKDIGIELIGKIGITSHFGDVLRQANIPSKIRSN